MSNLYDLKLIVKNVPADKEDAVYQVLNGFLESFDDYSYTGDEIDMETQHNLNLGATTEQAHKEMETAILAVLPTAKVITKWHYATWDYEDVYGEDEDQESQEYDKKLHEALIVVAEHDVNLLSYNGQTLWNKLAKLSEQQK